MKWQPIQFDILLKSGQKSYLIGDPCSPIQFELKDRKAEK